MKMCHFPLFTFIVLFQAIFFIPQVQGAVQHDKFVVLTPPKTGTHLLTKILSYMTEKQCYHHGRDVGSAANMLKIIKQLEHKNMFFDNHQVNPEIIHMLLDNNYKIVSLIRDPRDQLLSVLRWILEGRWPSLNLKHLTAEEQIDELILGTRFGWKAFEQCFAKTCPIRLIESLPDNVAYISRFEYLVGPKGGGNLEYQILEILNLASHIGVQLSVEKAEQIAKMAYGGTWSFRHGKIGSWKNQFSMTNKDTYKLYYGSLLIDWGYEEDYEW